MKNLTVVDNFYSQPERIRNFARDCEWLKPDALGPRFPGIESRRSFYSKATVVQFEDLIGAAIDLDSVTLPFGIFALGFAEHERNKVVHVDPCEWTGIVYLTLPEHCRGGTTLYRHRKSDLTAVPSADDLKNRGYRSAEDFLASEITQDQQISTRGMLMSM